MMMIITNDSRPCSVFLSISIDDNDGNGDAADDDGDDDDSGDDKYDAEDDL